jgi:hypothetical protein
VLHGRLTLGPAEPQGTRLVLDLPLAAPEARP